MEKINSIERGNKMKKYIKPSVISINDKHGLIPLAVAAGLSLVEAGAAAAFAGGVIAGLAATGKGDDRNVSSMSLSALPKCI